MITIIFLAGAFLILTGLFDVAVALIQLVFWLLVWIYHSIAAR